MIAGFSDSAGRRPAYIICFVIYIAANIGLGVQNSYAALLVLRCLQSAGSSGTVALANGVVGDIVTSSERGIYIGWASIGAVLGPALSPIIGGLLSQHLGWKWIFWFLTIFAVSFYVPLFLFFPETCREVVGDGSIIPPKLNMSLLDILRKRKQVKSESLDRSTRGEDFAKNRRLRFPNPLSTLIIISNKDAAIILFSTGLLIANFYAIASGMPSQFAEIYGLSDSQIGYCYLPFGFGSLVAAFTTGKAVDWNYRRHALRLGFPLTKNRQQDLSNFPIEKVRLQVAVPLLYFGVVCMIAYGWVLDVETNLAAPLIFQFGIGWCLIGAFQVMSILMIDILPNIPATATAANNLVRCLLGAGASAAVIPMINALGRGWTYTLLSLIWVVYSPTLLVLQKYGPGWRRERKEKEEKASDENVESKRAKTEKVTKEKDKEVETEVEGWIAERRIPGHSGSEEHREKTAATEQVSPTKE